VGWVGIPFEEKVVLFETPGWRDAIGSLSPSHRVPALRHGDVVVWDSLAICEYVAELFPEKTLWPTDRAARARARAVSAEMHAGFANMRRDMSMDIVARYPRVTPSAETEADVQRVLAIWNEHHGKGPFLFGDFSIADAMFAPVVWRFRTYGVPVQGARARAYYESMLGLPMMQAWEKDAEEEVRGLREAAAARPSGGTPDPRSAQHCFAVVFSAQRRKDDGREYAETAKMMEELASKMPGFLGIESARGEDGFGITVSYWESLEAIRAWKDEPRHKAAQARGRESFYERYELRVCTVDRGYKFSVTGQSR
jgi:glutathione S-transferase